MPEPSPSRLHEELAEKGAEVAVTNESGNPVTEPHEYLEIIVQNNTSADIEDVAVILATTACTFGIVGKGSSAGFLGWRNPVGTNAVIQWRDSEKIKKESRLDVSPVYPPEVPGQLTFTITSTNVAVGFHKLNRKP